MTTVTDTNGKPLHKGVWVERLLYNGSRGNIPGYVHEVTRRYVMVTFGSRPRRFHTRRIGPFWKRTYVCSHLTTDLKQRIPQF